MELVGIEDNLVEGCVTEGQCATFLNPQSRGLGSGDVDFPLTAGGEFRAEIADDVLLGQDVDKAAVVFLRHKITAICVHALLQNIGHIAEVGADSGKDSRAIGIAGTSLFLRHSGSRIGLVHDGLRRGLGKFRIDGGLSLHALHILAESHHISLHLIVGCGILGREIAFLVTMAVKEGFRTFPEFCPLVTKFLNRCHK